VPDHDFDVLAIGNAIVDVIAAGADDFLVEQGIAKGTMQLVDQAASDRLYAAMGPGFEASGGSASNTAAGVASLGGRAAFIGKVRDDQLGTVFAHDIVAAGVAFHNPPAPTGPPTARCMIVVTPDAQRTMSTFLGIAGQVTVDDIDEDLVARSYAVYCEGYLWDAEPTKDAIRRAMVLAKRHGRRVSLTLSDGFCVDRNRHEFVELAERFVDVLFANEVEICSLYETDDFDKAARLVAGHCDLAFLTRGAKGAVAVRGDERHEAPARPRGPVVDTTGAGDQFAAGSLWGLARGYDLPTCLRLGTLAAGEVVSHFGPRPQVQLQSLASEALG
jgi:sugar/nucleoside kinase (ribokinase family)